MMCHFTDIFPFTHYNYSWGKNAEKVVVKRNWISPMQSKIALVQNAKTKILDAKANASRKK